MSINARSGVGWGSNYTLLAWEPRVSQGKSQNQAKNIPVVLPHSPIKI